MKFQDDISNMNTYVRTYIHTYGQAETNMPPPHFFKVGGIIKGSSSVANLRKTMIYDTNIDLVNDNVYTKFGLNRSIRFKNIEQRLNCDVNQGPLLRCKFSEI